MIPKGDHNAIYANGGVLFATRQFTEDNCAIQSKVLQQAKSHQRTMQLFR